MELTTSVEQKSCDDIVVRISFSAINKLRKVVVYLTLISLTRICENWEYFLPESQGHRSTNSNIELVMLLPCSLQYQDEEKYMAAKYMENEIHRAKARNDRELKDLIKQGLVPSSAFALNKYISSQSIPSIDYNNIKVKTDISNSVLIYHARGKLSVDCSFDNMILSPFFHCNRFILTKDNHNYYFRFR